MVFSSTAMSQMTITCRAPESKTDTRYDYDNKLIKMALERTMEEYGPYAIKYTNNVTASRAMHAISNNEDKNMFAKLSYNANFSETKDMIYIPLPIDLGIVGYRVCFTSPEVEEKLKHVKTLYDLKKFTIGQGRGWSDVGILRYNGFQVEETAVYKSLFPMVARNRFDLFPRGVNEVLKEYQANKNIGGLKVDELIAIEYPLPRFFYTHKSSKKAFERIKTGLFKLYNDGSMQRLWREEYQESIDFANLKGRKIFHLKNPKLSGLDFDYRSYFYSID